jgi:hypothetical protein
MITNEKCREQGSNLPTFALAGTLTYRRLSNEKEELTNATVEARFPGFSRSLKAPEPMRHFRSSPHKKTAVLSGRLLMICNFSDRV